MYEGRLLAKLAVSTATQESILAKIKLEGTGGGGGGKARVARWLNAQLVYYHHTTSFRPYPSSHPVNWLLIPVKHYPSIFDSSSLATLATDIVCIFPYKTQFSVFFLLSVHLSPLKSKSAEKRNQLDWF